MGVRGLYTALFNQDSYFSHYDLSQGRIIIDLPSFFHHVYFKCHLNPIFGGELYKYKSIFEVWLNNFDKCGVIPLFISDGFHNPLKSQTVFKRAQERLKILKKIIDTNFVAISDFCPTLIEMVTYEIIQERGYHLYVCDSEADSVIAFLSLSLNAPIVSNDSDFFIFCCMYTGLSFIPLDSLDNIPKLAKNKDHHFLSCLIFLPDRCFLQNLNTFQLEAFSSLCGHDYTSNHFSVDVIFPSCKVNRLKKMKTLAKWLLNFSTEESCFQAILNKFKKQDRNRILNDLKTSKDLYRLSVPYPSEFTLDTHDCKFSFCPLNKLNERILNYFRKRDFDVNLLDSFFSESYVLSANIESIYNCSSVHVKSRPVRQVFYCKFYDCIKEEYDVTSLPGVKTVDNLLYVIEIERLASVQVPLLDLANKNEDLSVFSYLSIPTISNTSYTRPLDKFLCALFYLLFRSDFDNYFGTSPQFLGLLSCFLIFEAYPNAVERLLGKFPADKMSLNYLHTYQESISMFTALKSLLVLDKAISNVNHFIPRFQDFYMSGTCVHSIMTKLKDFKPQQRLSFLREQIFADEKIIPNCAKLKVNLSFDIVFQFIKNNSLLDPLNDLDLHPLTLVSNCISNDEKNVILEAEINKKTRKKKKCKLNSTQLGEIDKMLSINGLL